MKENIIINNNTNEKQIENKDKFEINNDIKVEKDMHNYKMDKKDNFDYFEYYRDGKRFSYEKIMLSILKKIILMISLFIAINVIKDFFLLMKLKNEYIIF